MELFEEVVSTRKRRDENENRSETLVIGDAVILLNDQMVYIRQEMNSDCSIPQLIGVMQQIRRSIQIGSKKRQRLVIFGSYEMVRMFYAPFKRDTIRDILMERLHAQKE
jgi:hypothetical protein